MRPFGFRDKIGYMFGDFGKGPKFNPYDPLTVPTGTYGRKGKQNNFILKKMLAKTNLNGQKSYKIKTNKPKREKTQKNVFKNMKENMKTKIEQQKEKILTKKEERKKKTYTIPTSTYKSRVESDSDDFEDE